MPRFFRELAEAANVLDPDREWERFRRVTGITDDDLTAAPRWTKWIERASKKPDPSVVAKQAQAANAHDRAYSKALFDERRQWDRDRCAPEEATAYANKILESLDAIGRGGSTR